MRFGENILFDVLKSSNLRELKSKIKMGLEGVIPLQSLIGHDEVGGRGSILLEQMTVPWGIPAEDSD
jgi:hypothetical protein